MSQTHEISTLQLWKRLHGEAGRPFFILDVRNEEEFGRWKAEGALKVPQVNVPYFEFVDDEEKALAKVPTDLGDAVVVCAKGSSSEYVAEVLRNHGRQAVNMAGGMTAWGDLHVPIQMTLASEDAGRFELWQFNRFGKGCLSYGVVAGGEMAVVDPSRFPEVYTAFAQEHGLRIVEILDTHVHADHLSGGPALAKTTGARYRVLNNNGGVEPQVGVPVTPLDASSIQIGGANGVRIDTQAIRTPGHTPGSTSFLVGGRYLLSGDTLFVKGVGRPDLGGQVEAWGRELFHTLREVVSRMPDTIEVFPSHFSDIAEADEKGAVRGNLGALRAIAPELAIDDQDEFVAAMKAGVKTPPAIYGEIVKANLGLVDPGEKAQEWELGRAECAATAAKKKLAEKAARAAMQA